MFTVVSFQTSQRAIEDHLDLATQYYLQGQDEALSQASIFRTVTSYLNALSGVAFVVGVGLTIAFAIANL